MAAAVCGQALATDEIIYHKQELGSVSLGVEVTSGKYGTPDNTTGLYMPLTLTWFPNSRLDVGVEIPFLYQSTSYQTNSTTQTSVPATAIFHGRGSGGMAANHSTTATSSSMDSHDSGIGDLIFRFGVIALFENDRVPQLRPSVYIKAPTASSSNGLGTGELDAGAGIEASKWIGDTHLTGEMFYNYAGKVAGLGLKNYFSYTAGLGYQVTANLQPMLLVNGSTQTYTGSEGLLELRTRLLWTISKTTTLDMFVSRGIASSSPDIGGGIAAIYSF